jgi:hypothetical protein
MKEFANMDQTAFESWVKGPILFVLGILGRYIVPVVCGVTGVESAKVNEWWTATIALATGAIVYGLSSWLRAKKVITTAAAVTDAKIAEYDKTPDSPASGGT